MSPFITPNNDREPNLPPPPPDRSKNAAERTVNFYLEQVERERAEVESGGGGGGGGGGWKRRPPTPASLWSTDTASTVERGGKKALVVDGKTLT